MGPEEVLGLRKPLEPRVLELFRYLAFHQRRHLRAGQILIGMWPSGSRRADLTEKTIRNYLGELRGALGVTHLPEAKAKEGYILLDVATDWDRFEALGREADVVGGTAAERLRDEALRLVRGVPFCDRTDEWIGTEGAATHMSEIIAKLALRLAQDRYLVGDFAGAKDAARRGLLGAPEDYALREPARCPSTPRATPPRSGAGWPTPPIISNPSISPGSRRRFVPFTTTRPSHRSGRRRAGPARPDGAPCARRRRGVREPGPPRPTDARPCGSPR